MKNSQKYIALLLKFLIVAPCFALFVSAKAESTMDSRYASMACEIENDSSKIHCDYRHSASLDVKEVSLKVSNVAQQIPTNGVTTYPAGQQTTAVLFLVDVSDANRKNTVENKNTQTILGMLEGLKQHQNVGLAVFDSDLRILAPINNDVAATKNALKSIKATGSATEFYKSIIEGIALLKQSNASRKGLVLLSDGKAEDSAYRHDDAIKAASDAGVVILGLGYAEKPQDTPDLQRIKRLAEDTYGLYFDATNFSTLPFLSNKPLAFVEKGGRVTFDQEKRHGEQDVSVTLRAAGDRSVEIISKLNFPDTRSDKERVVDFFTNYWVFLTLGLFALLLCIFFSWKFISKRRIARKQPGPYAYLAVIGESDVNHPLQKNAVRLGRSADNDICFANNTISSHHAEINRRREGQIYIVDLGSANGIFVNETKVNQAELRNGDVIELGEVRLRFIAQ